jgi:hypothetical protein
MRPRRNEFVFLRFKFPAPNVPKLCPYQLIDIVQCFVAKDAIENAKAEASLLLRKPV